MLSMSHIDHRHGHFLSDIVLQQCVVKWAVVVTMIADAAPLGIPLTPWYFHGQCCNYTAFHQGASDSGHCIQMAAWEQRSFSIDVN